MENKLELLERLIKEEKITLKEALVLLDDGGGKKETPVSPYTTPYTTPTKNPYRYDVDPFHVTCGTTSYPEGTTVRLTN